jgi:hypothetical protein
VVVSSLGLVMPNATALALAGHPDVAGSASGLLGVMQFIVGAATAPLVGVAGTGTALPMALVIAALGAGGACWPRRCAPAAAARRRAGPCAPPRRRRAAAPRGDGPQPAGGPGSPSGAFAAGGRPCGP